MGEDVGSGIGGEDRGSALTPISGRPLNSHFKIDVEEGVGYTYIRKNACSAFKRLIVATSSATTGEPARGADMMPFMGKHHKISPSELGKLPTRIVVLRAPIQRVVSAYVNQFVMRLRKRSRDMHGAIGAALGKQPGQVTFEDFVFGYLPLGANRINNHFIPQTLHLAPIKYTHVLNQRHLFDDVRQIFGAEIADAFFAERINSTAELSDREDPHASKRTALEIFEELRHSGRLPSKASFLAPHISDALGTLYRQDVLLWQDYRRQRKLAGKQPVSMNMSRYAGGAVA